VSAAEDLLVSLPLPPGGAAVWPARAYACASDLLASYVEALVAVGRPVDRWEVIVGSPAPIDCCAGYAYATVRRIYYSSTFPADDALLAGAGVPGFDPLACGTGSPAMLLELGIVRCLPTLSDTGAMPALAGVALATSGLYYDAELLVTIASCSGPWNRTTAAVNLGEPSGGCVGAAASLSVDLDEAPAVFGF
jgi:hypothetical protein